MIDVEQERAASLARQGIEAAEQPLRCPCGEPVARGRFKFCSYACAEEGRAQATAQYQLRRKQGLPTATQKRDERNQKIYAARRAGMSCPQIATKFGLSDSAVFYIVNGRKSPFRDHVRVVLLVNRAEAERWRACARDMPLTRWIYDLVSSEAERRSALIHLLRAYEE